MKRPIASCLMSVLLLLACSITTLAEEPAYDAQPEATQRAGGPWLSRLGGLRLPSMFERNSARVRRAFRQTVAEPKKSTARVLCNGEEVALATVVSAEGYLLTKASELHGTIVVELFDGRRLPATIVGVHSDCDLAMLQVGASDLTAVQWRGDTLPVGSWVATPSHQELPASIGIVSVTPRPVAASPGVLGIRMQPTPKGAEISLVHPESGAERAGLKVNDLIIGLNGQRINSQEQVIETVRQFRPGDRVQVDVIRGTQKLSLSVLLTDYEQLAQGGQVGFQESLGGPLSHRRVGFPSVLQHDTVLRPEDCGGPLVDLDGQAVGINIARAGRVASYAIPAEVILPLIPQFLSGKFAPPGSIHSAVATSN